MGGAVIPAKINENDFKSISQEMYNESLFNKLRGADGLIDQQVLREFEKTCFDAFLTHYWGFDELQRDNHKRVQRFNQGLKKRNFRVWFDEESLKGNIQKQMSDGIDCSAVVLVFITQRYMDKVEGKGAKGELDNCMYEFSYAAQTKGRKMMIPVVMEPR